jgi:hypothetical protein
MALRPAAPETPTGPGRTGTALAGGVTADPARADTPDGPASGRPTTTAASAAQVMVIVIVRDRPAASVAVLGRDTRKVCLPVGRIVREKT